MNEHLQGCLGPLTTFIVSYADDIPMLPQQISDLVTSNNWIKGQHLELSPGKASTTIFPNWTKQVITPLGIRI